MARFCTKCGGELKQGSRFCTKCGSPIEDVAPPNVNTGNNVNQQTDTTAQEIQNWKATRRRNKLIPIAIGIGVVLVALFFFFRNSGPDKDQVQKDLAVYLNVPKNVAEHLSVKSVKINDTSLDDSKTIADVTTTATLESEDVRKVQSYKLNYSKVGDSSWLCNQIYPYNDNNWKAEPLHGVSENTIKRSLIGVKVNADKKNNVVLKESDIGEVKIDKQDTDLKKGTDAVQFTYKIKSKIASLEQKASASFHFERDHWQMDNLKVDEKQQIVYNKGYDFKRTDEALKADLFKSPIMWKTNYGTQTISITNNTVRNFKKLPEAFEWKTGLITQRCTFDLMKRVVTFHVDADVVYEYTSSGWQVTKIHYLPKVQNIDLKGIWTGHYTAWSEKPSLSLTINNQDANNMLTATFAFGPSSNAPAYKSGSYSMIGGIEKDTLIVRMKGDNWINRPRNFVFVNLDGVLLVDQEKIADKGEDFAVTLTQKY